jgi:hypothetical protein
MPESPADFYQLKQHSKKQYLSIVVRNLFMRHHHNVIYQEGYCGAKKTVATWMKH